MLNYPCTFAEGFTPQSGIDTISIWIHPAIINQRDMFHEYGNNNAKINLRYKPEINHRNGNYIRVNFFFDIQSEAINPNQDIFDQILNIITQMAFDGILCLPNDSYQYDIKNFFRVNFDHLFALDGLDFYHDLRSDDMVLLGNPNPKYPNTRYSSIYPSVLKAYLRTERLRQKRHTPYEEIDNIDYPARIEFTLRRGNCDYLNIRNLTGTYENVFLQYLPFLARKWLDYKHGVVEVASVRDLSYAHDLRQIIAVAGHRIPHPDLLKAPLKPIPYKQARKNETDLNWVAGFYASQCGESPESRY
jgi:hypothetical protein